MNRISQLLSFGTPEPPASVGRSEVGARDATGGSGEEGEEAHGDGGGLQAVLTKGVQALLGELSAKKHAALKTACESVLADLRSGKISMGSAAAADEEETSTSEGKGKGKVGAVRPPVEQAVPAETLDAVLPPFILACETGSTRLCEIAYATMTKVVKGGHVGGSVGSNQGAGGSGGVSGFQKFYTAACSSLEHADDDGQIELLRLLVAAVTSQSLDVHSECLLASIRAAFNIYLGNKNPVNQSSARAALVEIVEAVNRKVEDRPDSHDRLENGLTVADGERAGTSSSEENSGGVPKEVAEDQKVGRADGTPAASTSRLQGTGFSSEWEMDAFIMFRTLCKLSSKHLPESASADSVVLVGKLLSLELLKHMLENAGPRLQSCRAFVLSQKEHLCASLLKNCVSHSPQVFRLSVSIFVTLLRHYRSELKVEIGLFFSTVLLRIMESPAGASMQQRLTVLKVVHKLCQEPQLLVDIFVNYDCDIDSPNVFEAMINVLCKVAQEEVKEKVGSEKDSDGMVAIMIRQGSLQCLIGVVKSMREWIDRADGGKSSEGLSKDPNGTDSAASDDRAISRAVASPSMQPGPESGTPGGGDSEIQFEAKRKHKKEMAMGVKKFNQKPKAGIKWLIEMGKIGNSPADIANFLKDEHSLGLDKDMIGEYIGGRDPQKSMREDFVVQVMWAYIDSLTFEGLHFDDAIRHLLSGFRLPGEAQKIDRIMEKFAERFVQQNPGVFDCADTAYVLAYSTIMLNTDAHNPGVKNKMSMEAFRKNNKGIGKDGADVPQEYLDDLYTRITTNEIKMKETESAMAQFPFTGKNQSSGLIYDLFRSKDDGADTKQAREAFVEATQELFREKGGGKSGRESGAQFQYFTASSAEHCHPMLEVSWGPLLAAFFVGMENANDPQVITMCLEGIKGTIHIAGQLGIEVALSGFVQSLAKFTLLGNRQREMRPKNVQATQVLLEIAVEEGNYLGKSWEPVLSSLSQLHRLCMVMETLPEATTGGSTPGSASRRREKVHPTELQHARSLQGIVDAEVISRIYFCSPDLSGDAIVDFVTSLCEVSRHELFRAAEAPLLFSLQKIVEVADVNMGRIKIVWSRVWSILQDYFTSVIAHEDPAIAMYVVDALKQMATKFLSKDELSNFHFQKEFLKPFVTFLQGRPSLDLRDLVARCVTQLAVSKALNIKSGWESVLQSLSLLAVDEEEPIVKLAFDAMVALCDDHFDHIAGYGENFGGIVNCLASFAAGSVATATVSVKAIDYMSLCGDHIAAGDIVSLRDGVTRLGGRGFSDCDEHRLAWLTLCKALSRLTSDTRPEIRDKAMRCLFEDVLGKHGHLMSTALWEKIFMEVLFPIFATMHQLNAEEIDQFVMDATMSMLPGALTHQSPRQSFSRMGSGGQGSPTNAESSAEKFVSASSGRGDWIHATLYTGLQLMVELFSKFYGDLVKLLDPILGLLVSCMKMGNEGLASIGVTVFVRLANVAGPQFSDEVWSLYIAALSDAVDATLPVDIMSHKIFRNRIIQSADMSRIEVFTDDERSESESVSNTLGRVESLDEANSEEAVSHATPADNNSRGKNGAPPAEGAASDSRLENAMFVGSGIRRSQNPETQRILSKVRCQCVVQLILIQAIHEIFVKQATSLSFAHLESLVAALQKTSSFAKGFNLDIRLRELMRRAGSMSQTPSLLRQESEGTSLGLTILVHLHKLARAGSGEETLPRIEKSLVESCLETLADFSGKEKNQDTPAHYRRELVHMVPIVVQAAQVLCDLPDGVFQERMPELWHVLLEVVNSEYAKVRAAVTRVLRSRVTPLLNLP